MNARLWNSLEAVGKNPQVVRYSDGSELVVLPHGGRILGLFSAGSEDNFFWTHPALDTADTANDFFAGDQWHNTGGDRTWLAPEVDFFFPNFPRTDVYWQPRQLDPGRWELEVESETLRLTNRLVCRLSRSQAELDAEITKSVSQAPNPLRYEQLWNDLRDVTYAGYTLSSALELKGDRAPLPGPVGLWNLIQLPHGGDLLVPTYGRAHPRILFGHIEADDLTVFDGRVCYAMRANGEQKLGIRAVAATGRAGYRYPGRDGRWSLVVRNAQVNPSGLYVDVPWGDTGDFGYAIQACNVHSDLGSFSELEYHVPAIGASTARNRCEDVCQTWAFRGSREAIDQIVECLLTPLR